MGYVASSHISMFLIKLKTAAYQNIQFACAYRHAYILIKELLFLNIWICILEVLKLRTTSHMNY